METKKPLIFVSNDDGIFANGVHCLIDRLLQFGDVVAVCPDSPRSAQSMALTVNSPLRVTQVDDYHGAKMYKVNGTPVDCVKLSMHNVLPRIPDLVVSGINHGSNASINVLYSGTMGVAFEGCAFGIPSIGFSLTDHSPAADFEPCYPFIDAIVKGVLEHGLPEGVCLNVNIPNSATPPTEMRLTTTSAGTDDADIGKSLHHRHEIIGSAEAAAVGQHGNRAIEVGNANISVARLIENLVWFGKIIVSRTSLMSNCATGYFVVDQSAYECLDISEIAASIVANVDDKAFTAIENGKDIIEIKIAYFVSKRGIIHISYSVGKHLVGDSGCL